MRKGRRGRVGNRILLFYGGRLNADVGVSVDREGWLLGELLLVLTHLVHFAVHVGRRALAVANAAADPETARTLEVRVLDARLDLELLIQLLQTEDALAIGTSDTAFPLPALRLPAKMARLHQTGIFRFINRLIGRIG